MPGDEPSSWCLDTLPTSTTDARDPEETYLSAAAHAALRYLGMQVHLELAERGNVRWFHARTERRLRGPLDPTMRGNVICRDHAEVCTIFATSGGLLPVVPWDGEKRAFGAGRSHRHLLKKDCQGRPSPLRRALGPTAAHHRRMSTRLLLRSIHRQRRSGSGQDAPTDRENFLLAAGIEAA
ncbi:surface protease GP63 [Trypanosoma cruzi]|nr:surface protease GP63 [Trypanosoma cruzi]